MTTPVNFNTADRIMRMGYKDAGLLQDGDDPTSEMVADGINRLNDIINLAQTQGLKLWLQFDLAITLTAGLGLYTLGPGGVVNMTKPMRILDDGYYVDSGGNSRPIIMMSMDEYLRLSNKTQQGPITSFVPQKLQTQINVTFWLIPDTFAAQGVAHLFIQQQVANFAGVTDTMNFPQEWFMWLRWAFASDCSNGQPQAIMDRCTLMAASYQKALEDWDVEDASTTFTPDQRVGYSSGRFR